MVRGPGLKVDIATFAESVELGDGRLTGKSHRKFCKHPVSGTDGQFSAQTLNRCIDKAETNPSPRMLVYFFGGRKARLQNKIEQLIGGALVNLFAGILTRLNRYLLDLL